MQQIHQSQQFSFCSHQASQGSSHQPYSRRKTTTPSNKIKNEAKFSEYTLTKTQSKNEKKKLAGMKSRQKKKDYIKCLEENVRWLDKQIQQVDQQVSKYKDQLVEALRTSNNNSNQHAFTFAQLEKHAYSEDPNLDKINLLIDLIRNRMGADSKERQAKLDYSIKQIINSMFPAIYRYLFYSAHLSVDIFQPSVTPESLNNPDFWTYEVHQRACLEDWQIARLNDLKEKFLESRKEAIVHAARLRTANQTIKRQGQAFQKRLGDFREDMTPIQCAKITLFAEKNKLRKQFGLCTDFQEGQLRKKIKIE